jgi:glyoxylase-like metal-dependent hydrolase (beta-lactamase superfamily II)
MSIRVWKTALLIAALGMTVPLQAQDPDALIHDPYRTSVLIDGVRLMATPPNYLAFATSNIVLIEQSDGIVVVDSGATRADGDRIVAYIRSFTDKPVKAVVFTHWHNDHPAGASQIVAAWPNVRVIATEGTRRGIDGPARSLGMGYEPSAASDTALLGQVNESIAFAEAQAENPEHDARLRGRYRQMAAEFRRRLPDVPGTRLVAPTEILTDRMVIDDPERPVHILYLGRANTDGDAIVWLPNQRIVAAGDVVVSPIPFGFASYPQDWITTLGRIKELGFDVLIPGHGLPQSDSAYIDRLIATITDIRTQVGALAAQGLTLEQIRERADFSAQTAIFGTSPGRRRGFEGLWLRPMVENAYKEARGMPIVAGEGETP